MCGFELPLLPDIQQQGRVRLLKSLNKFLGGNLWCEH